MTGGLEQKLPIDAVEEALDVEIEHPVAAPTALTSRAHGIDRRFAGSVAVGVGVKHRLHNQLQIASGDVLSDAVRNRRNAQRSRPTIRLTAYTSAPFLLLAVTVGSLIAFC